MNAGDSCARTSGRARFLDPINQQYINKYKPACNTDKQKKHDIQKHTTEVVKREALQYHRDFIISRNGDQILFGYFHCSGSVVSNSMRKRKEKDNCQWEKLCHAKNNSPMALTSANACAPFP